MILAIGAYAVFAGVDITFSTVGLLLVACLAPPAVMLMVWGGGSPPATVAELLHAVNRPSKDNRP